MAVHRKTPCNAGNIRKAWATIVKARRDDGDISEIKIDLADFKAWLRTPVFLQVVDRDPLVERSGQGMNRIYEACIRTG